MFFDVSRIEPQNAYKLMTSTVVPRPIAWVSTLSEDGVANAAPYSFFNVMGSDPATVVIGIQKDAKRGFKDSAHNILTTGEFVVNLVNEAVAEKMNISCIDAPRDVSEFDIAGLTQRPSQLVKPPQIAESPVSFECVNLTSLVTGPRQTLVVGRVVGIRIEDEYILDADKAYVDTPALHMIGRTYGSGWYTKTADQFQMGRPVYDDWIAKNGDPKKG
ncbi:flavin reductase family protein [Rhodospirillaceae bacterium KN72]|uniref:Flavin reductase family protein n=1 Tax=Pacificispira spongiicola TaxID=2729598 RepID=A0A7Y0DWI3_9PROT|nr:flavin reductase family protein [Pacificispira spongiicola]NMM42870.1 flavin reductase family protein [Pacificispira spongiicola]